MSVNPKPLDPAPQQREEGGSRVLIETLDHPDYEDSEDPLIMVTPTAAINYIAYGRYDGAMQDREWFDMTPQGYHEDLVHAEGAAEVGRRLLERAIRLGALSVYEAERVQAENGECHYCLWRIVPASFTSYACIYGSERRGLENHRISGDGITVERPLFAAEAINAMADPADDYSNRPDDSDDGEMDGEGDQPKRRRKRFHTRDYGEPLGTFAAELLAMDRQQALSDPTAALGALLTTHFERLGIKPPDEATTRQMATNLRKGLFGLGS